MDRIKSARPENAMTGSAGFAVTTANCESQDVSAEVQAMADAVVETS